MKDIVYIMLEIAGVSSQGPKLDPSVQGKRLFFQKKSGKKYRFSWEKLEKFYGV